MDRCLTAWDWEAQGTRPIQERTRARVNMLYQPAIPERNGSVEFKIVREKIEVKSISDCVLAFIGLYPFHMSCHKDLHFIQRHGGRGLARRMTVEFMPHDCQRHRERVCVNTDIRNIVSKLEEGLEKEPDRGRQPCGWSSTRTSQILPI